MAIMRLVALLLVALAALVATTNAQQFSNLAYSPDGSKNNFYRGTAYTFTWTQPATTTSVYLRVCTDQACSASAIVDTAGPFSVTGTTGSLTYTCRARINERVYWIAVSDATTPTIRDYLTRTISPAVSSFTWTYPSSSIQLPRLTPITFTWTTVGTVLTVDLTFTSSSTSVVIGRNITNTGSYTWTAGADVPLTVFTPRLFSNITDGSQNPINAAGSYVTIGYPSVAVVMTSMSSSTTMSPGSSQVLTWTVTPSNLILSWNISLMYGSDVTAVVARGLTTTSFRFTASYPERSYYFLRLIPFQVDASLIGYKLSTSNSDTGYISISKSNDSSGGGGGGSAGIGIGAVFVLGAVAFAGYKRWKQRQERRAFAKMQGIANDANNPPPPPIVDDQYVTEGIPLCYFSNPNYAPPGAQPAVLIPVVSSPVGHVGLVPQH